MSDYINNLPKELILIIIDHLDIESISNLSFTDLIFYEKILDNYEMKKLYNKINGIENLNIDDYKGIIQKLNLIIKCKRINFMIDELIKFLHIKISDGWTNITCQLDFSGRMPKIRNYYKFLCQIIKNIGFDSSTVKEIEKLQKYENSNSIYDIKLFVANSNESNDYNLAIQGGFSVSDKYIIINELEDFIVVKNQEVHNILFQLMFNDIEVYATIEKD